MASRYYQQNVAQYNPLSFEEMLFAPSMMRQNHDQLDQGLATTNTELGQYNSLSQDNDFVQKAIDPVSAQLNTMAESLSKEGFNRQQMSGFRKIRAEKDNLFGAQGDVGIAQARYASFQAQSADLKKQYEKNPKIANYFINKLGQSKGLSRDSQGNIQNQSLDAIDNVRHYDAKEIGDLLNQQISNIKDSTLESFGFTDVGDISTVQDLYKQGTRDGISKERVYAILQKQVSPEIRASARQYGNVMYNDAQIGLDALNQQIAGAALGRETNNDNSRYSVVTDADAQNRKDKIYDGLYTDSGRLSLPTNNPLKDLKYKDGNIQTKPVTPGKSVIEGADPLAPGNRRINQDANIDYNNNIQKANEQLKHKKRTVPSLTNMTDEEAFNTINQYYENIGEVYVGIAHFNKNMDVINKVMKNNMLNSTFMTSNGEVINFSELAESVGLTEDELTKNNAGTTGVEINPIIGANVPIVITDSKGKKIQVYQQLDKESQAIVKDTQMVLAHLYNDADSKEIRSVPLGEGVNKNTYVINNYVDEPFVITTNSNLMPRDLKEFSQMSREELKKTLPMSVIQGVKEMVGQTNKALANNIQNKDY